MSGKILTGELLENELEALLRTSMAAARIGTFRALADLSGRDSRTFRPLGGHTTLQVFIDLAQVLGCSLRDLLPNDRAPVATRPRLLLGAAAFVDARELERLQVQRGTKGRYDSPILTLAESKRASGFQDVRMERAWAAWQVLKGQMTVEPALPAEETRP